MLLSNITTAGTWIAYGLTPSAVNWGTNTLDLATTIVSNGTWQGGTITSAYGGTGLTTFVAANNALYSTSAGALAAGTLPVLAGGTGVTTSTGSVSVVLSTSPTLVTPVIGAATGTSLVVTAEVTGAEIIASNGMIVNNATVSTSYTIPTGYNATATGPMTIAGGAVVSIPSGSRWLIL